LKKKRVFSLFVLILSIFVLVFQMYPLTLAMDFGENAGAQNDAVTAAGSNAFLMEEVQDGSAADSASGAENTAVDSVKAGLSDYALADDTTGSLVKAQGFFMLGQKAGDPYVITNDADLADRYAYTTFSDLQTKITELAANGNAYTLTLNQNLEVPQSTSLTFAGPSTWTVLGNGNTVMRKAGSAVDLNRIVAIGETGKSCAVTLKNVIVDGVNQYSACRIIEGSTLTLDSDATIRNGFNGAYANTIGGIHMNDNTKLYMKPGSKMLGNTAAGSTGWGGAILMRKNCVVDIDGAVISDN
jgi:hypothetical protein